jgi:hypothetical protein
MAGGYKNRIHNMILTKVKKLIYNKNKENIMFSVKESIEQVKIQFLELFGSDITDVRLEEMNENNKNEYYFTISFLVPNKNKSTSITSVLTDVFPYTRQYKNVVVNKDDGNIISIKIHTNA